MANNQAQDRYNPGAVSAEDWETHKYQDLPDGEIFYLEANRTEGNHAYRKRSDKEALNTKMQTYHEVLSNITVYTKI
tara:strand:- start:1852 stop:2082 length:231 start_codon:yes stop_codon:yes gene_type:complete